MMKFFAKSLLLVAATMAVAGCWEAKTPLMPASERVVLPIVGRYNKLPMGQGEYLVLAPQRDRSYVATRWKEGRVIETLDVSIDQIDDRRLATVAPTLATNAKAFVLETSMLDAGERITYYSLLLVDRTDTRFAQLLRLPPACSDAVRAIVGAPKGGKCLFTAYPQVEAAITDLLRWMNDPRLQLEMDTYARPEA